MRKFRERENSVGRVAAGKAGDIFVELGSLSAAQTRARITATSRSAGIFVLHASTSLVAALSFTSAAAGGLLVQVNAVGWPFLLVAGQAAMLLLVLEEVMLVGTPLSRLGEEGTECCAHLNLQSIHQAKGCHIYSKFVDTHRQIDA